MIAKRFILIMCIFCLSYLGCTNMKSSPEKLLEVWWKSYKKNFVLSSGRVQRPDQDLDTVSEGQAYAMFFSVFMNDKKTFDRIYGWTEKHLSRNKKEGDHLLAWHWKEGDVDDWMPASDADCDYAFALLLASYKWKETIYSEKAIQVINDILEFETIRGNGNRLFLLPGIWGNEENGYLIQNPSYYSPAAFRLFFENTQDSRWLDLLETGYWILHQSSNRLGNLSGCGLVPDWCVVDSDGNILTAESRSNNYGWEAIRVPMRVGFDILWYKTEKGNKILEKIYYALQTSNSDLWGTKAVYCYTGEPAVEYDSLAATAMACFTAQVSNFKKNKLKTLLVNMLNEESSILDYYGQSLVFYSLALEGGVLGKPSKAF